MEVVVAASLASRRPLLFFLFCSSSSHLFQPLTKVFQSFFASSSAADGAKIAKSVNVAGAKPPPSEGRRHCRRFLFSLLQKGGGTGTSSVTSSADLAAGRRRRLAAAAAATAAAVSQSTKRRRPHSFLCFCLMLATDCHFFLFCLRPAMIRYRWLDSFPSAFAPPNK